MFSTDIKQRGNFIPDSIIDFLEYKDNKICKDIITNPPYIYAKEFVEHALDIQEIGYYTIMLLRIQFLESKNREQLFKKYPPKYVYVNTKRQKCFRDNDSNVCTSSSVTCFCWFFWEKGFKGEPIIRWI